jgi:hypothetical protein
VGVVGEVMRREVVRRLERSLTDHDCEVKGGGSGKENCEALN